MAAHRPAPPDEDDDPQPKRAPSLGDFHVETEKERRERILRVVDARAPGARPRED